jgi:hypothetical protein
MIVTERMSGVGHVAQVWETRNLKQLLAGNLEGKKLSEIAGADCRMMLKWIWR